MGEIYFHTIMVSSNASKRLFRFLCLSLLSFLLYSCGPKSTTIVSEIPGYNVNQPKAELKFPPLLDEISGITYYAKDSSLFAIQDEEGFIYKIFPYHPDSMLRYKFAGRGDFEDVALANGIFYVLRSDGDIYAANIATEVKTQHYNFPEKNNEFEGLFYDDSVHKLRLMCKDCQSDGHKHLSTWLFDPQTGQYSNDSMRIDSRELAEILGEKKIKFKPSAVAIHPITHRLYILSAVNHVIVSANRDGSIINTCMLDKKIYKQPEGLAFAPDGTMFITNESAKVGAANLFIIPYNNNVR